MAPAAGGYDLLQCALLSLCALPTNLREAETILPAAAGLQQHVSCWPKVPGMQQQQSGLSGRLLASLVSVLKPCGVHQA